MYLRWSCIVRVLALIYNNKLKKILKIGLQSWHHLLTCFLDIELINLARQMEHLLHPFNVSQKSIC